VQVQLFNSQREYQLVSAELLEAAERVLASGHYILGGEVSAFEDEIRRYLGVRYAFGVASGTDALWLALKAAGIGPGDRVLTSPYTFFATASAIFNTGAEPVLADVEPDTLNLDPASVRSVLEGSSEGQAHLEIDPASIKALVPVHIFGQPADMDVLLPLARSFGLHVIEDAAQALGAEYKGKMAGTMSEIGCYSFFPTKNLGGFGDGGLVVTDDDELAERLRLLRAHGSDRRYFHELIGTNSRLDGLQAALLGVKLRRLDEALSGRLRAADQYDEGFAEDPNVRPPARMQNRSHTYHQYAIRVPADVRDEVRSTLASNGVETAVHYPVPLHLQSALGDLGYKPGDFPEAEQASRETISLPMFPSITPEECRHVIESVRRVIPRLPMEELAGSG
jgi:dTDP-4-amino-4,6-dideoxygalactose transaminase